jgi:hypothetical protein
MSLLRQSALLSLLAILLAILVAHDAVSDRHDLPCSTPATLDQPPLDTLAIAVQYILENPVAYVGARLTVGGEIVDIWPPQAFTLVGHQSVENDALLVVTRDELTSLSPGSGSLGFHGALVRVTGTVLTDVAAAERELELALSQSLHRRRSAKAPVLIADRVVFVRDR